MKHSFLKIIFLLFLASCCCQKKASFYSKKCLPDVSGKNNCLAFYKNYELPKYQVQKVINEKIEIRYYQPKLVAEVSVSGTRKEAVKNGFRTLASYIFGNNTSKSSIEMTSPVLQQNSQKIDMTSPVLQQNSQKIDMTSPVNQVKQAPDQWLIQFGMPHHFTLDTLPKPKNADIVLRVVPAQKAAVISFSGSWSDEKFAVHLQELQKYLTENNLSAIAEPSFAYYDDPFTFPWNRKNEIIWQIQEK
jgi:hypothetical protein